MRFTELLECLRRELGPDLASRAAHAIRLNAGGERIHVPTRAPRVEVRPSDTPERLALRAGISKRSAYRWLNQARKRRI